MGMVFVFFAVSILSSIAGSICGIGGGVIIKPVLDAVGIMSVSSISFLSGCTVLAMSLVSVYKNIKAGSGSRCRCGRRGRKIDVSVAEAGGRERRAGGTGTGFGVDCHHAGNTGLYII